MLKIRNTLILLQMARPRNLVKYLEKKMIGHFCNLWIRISLIVPFPHFSKHIIHAIWMAISHTLFLFSDPRTSPNSRLYHLHISRYLLVSKLPYKLEQLVNNVKNAVEVHHENTPNHETDYTLASHQLLLISLLWS